MTTLTNISLGQWNTSNVTYVSECFKGCTSLTSIPSNLFGEWERDVKAKQRRIKIDKIRRGYGFGKGDLDTGGEHLDSNM